MVGQKGIVLHLGDVVHYRSKSMIHPEATYEGVVVGVYKHFYEVLGTPLRNTMKLNNDWVYGVPKPYKFCINKYADTTMERVTVKNSIYLEERTA